LAHCPGMETGLKAGTQTFFIQEILVGSLGLPPEPDSLMEGTEAPLWKQYVSVLAEAQTRLLMY